MGILEMNKKYVGGKILFDDYLYSDGAMGSHDVEMIVSFWTEQGLVPFEEKDGQQCWNDLCVVNMTSGPTLPCDWLEFEIQDNSDGTGYFSFVYLKGKPKGKLVSFAESINQI